VFSKSKIAAKKNTAVFSGQTNSQIEDREDRKGAVAFAAAP